MDTLEYTLSNTGDHLPKRRDSETVDKVAQILRNNPNATFYDSPDDDWQSLLAHKTPGSEVAAKKYWGIPSWKRHSGD